MPEIRDPKSTAEDLTKLAKDAVYVTVGLAVIAFQKAQVQRQELRKQVSGQVGDAKAQLQSLTKVFEDRVKVVEERLEGVETRFESLLDQLEERLPEQAREVAKQARTAAKDARTQVRGLVSRGAA
jgi:chaperonin cofactor prefoldin